MDICHHFPLSICYCFQQYIWYLYLLHTFQHYGLNQKIVFLIRIPMIYGTGALVVTILFKIATDVKKETGASQKPTVPCETEA